MQIHSGCITTSLDSSANRIDKMNRYDKIQAPKKISNFSAT
uniref:Uncharacterized protein n=1 Tax=Meloidogyne enterolobii TaxID=390850 RepID=A0A6V7V9Y6_MELEN|nr:unnamed protein product [Meloidogyne enterolobii]